jgi:hypothetical protein
MIDVINIVTNFELFSERVVEQFLNDNLFVMLGGLVFQQKFGTPISPNCTLLANLFTYSYKAESMQRLLKKNEKKPAYINI